MKTAKVKTIEEIMELVACDRRRNWNDLLEYLVEKKSYDLINRSIKDICERYASQSTPSSNLIDGRELLEKIIYYIENDAECLMEIKVGITKKQYGLDLLKVLCQELRDNFKDKILSLQSSPKPSMKEVVFGAMSENEIKKDDGVDEYTQKQSPESSTPVVKEGEASNEQWEKAYLAGYEKRSEMSGLPYDFASELHAKSHFIKWKSKQPITLPSPKEEAEEWKEKYETAVKQKIAYSKEVDRLKDKYEPEKGIINDSSKNA